MWGEEVAATCPEACENRRYEASLSYSQISVPAIRRVLSTAQMTDIQTRFRRALGSQDAVRSSWVCRALGAKTSWGQGATASF